MTLALVALGLGYDFEWAIKAVMKMLILSEGISILTNYLSIRENRNIKNRDYIAIILRFFRSKMSNVFRNITSNNNK
jgi:hypothetical protein